MPWRDSQIETACQLGRGTAQRERRFPLTQTQETQSTESAFSSVECHVSNKWIMKWLPTVEQQHLHCVAYRRSPTVTFVRVVLLRLALASCPTQREQQTTHQWPLPRHIWTTDPHRRKHALCIGPAASVPSPRGLLEPSVASIPVLDNGGGAATPTDVSREQVCHVIPRARSGDGVRVTRPVAFVRLRW